jgi:hypothetical protein
VNGNTLFANDSDQASHGGELAAAVTADVVAQIDVTEFGAVLIEEADGRRSAGTSRSSTRPAWRSRT